MNQSILLQIGLMAILLESLIQTIKPIWKPEEATLTYYISLGVGMLVSAGINYLAGLDLFSAVGIPLVKAPWVGVVATGIILSRGSNIVHDLLSVLLAFKDSLSDLFKKVENKSP